MKREFKVGDKIIYVGPNSTVFLPCKGDTGTVCIVNNQNQIGVEFDRKFQQGHHCRGFANPGHGYWVFSDLIELVPKVLSIKQWKEAKDKKEWIEIPEINLQLLSVQVVGKERKIKLNFER